MAGISDDKLDELKLLRLKTAEGQFICIEVPTWDSLIHRLKQAELERVKALNILDDLIHMGGAAVFLAAKSYLVEARHQIAAEREAQHEH